MKRNGRFVTDLSTVLWEATTASTLLSVDNNALLWMRVQKMGRWGGGGSQEMFNIKYLCNKYGFIYYG